MSDSDRVSRIQREAADDAKDGKYDPPSVTSSAFSLSEETTERETTERKAYDDSHANTKTQRGW